MRVSHHEPCGVCHRHPCGCPALNEAEPPDETDYSVCCLNTPHCLSMDQTGVCTCGEDRSMRAEIARLRAKLVEIADRSRLAHVDVARLKRKLAASKAAFATLRDAVEAHRAAMRDQSQDLPQHDGLSAWAVRAKLVVTTYDMVTAVLATPPSTVLAAHDAKVRASALREAADAWLRGPACGDETSGTYAWLGRQADEAERQTPPAPPVAPA